MTCFKCMIVIEFPEKCIGRKVKKKSGKPFKCGRKIVTVKGVVQHPTLDVPCFTFKEDDSYVVCRICELT